MPGYTVSLADGTEDAGNWTIEPKMGLNGDGTETVTITYNGTKRVKSVKAVKKASGPEVTTFSDLQTALSAGKDVKLMNDIVCTAEIEITSDGALTIDGNGKTLSTTSAIRAFKVGSSATVAFKDLTITGFVSGGGPAINNSGTIVLDGCTISNCHVNNTNGGGAIESSGKLYAINTTFSGNYSGEIGGAINNNGSSLYMSGCTFTDNYTTSSNAFCGGAIGINGGSEVRLINCSFSGNKYGTTTGTNDIGVYSKPANYTIAGCTGATIASNDGDITPIASGTATLDYSDLSNISFTYNAEPAPASGTDLSALPDGVYEAQDGETLTGTLTNNVMIIIADGATVTLKDVNITNLGDDCNWAGINCPGDATLVLEGTNEVCAGRDGGYNNYPGIYIAPGKTLTIQGAGTLTAYSDASNPDGAGIGGGFDIACGHIVINSGNITATGGNNAAGIGGRDASCGNITINGGTVTATGGQYAAGIGGGDGASCGNITISGGTVEATGGDYGAGIGTGYTDGHAISCGAITISGGTVTATGGKWAAGIGSGYNGGGEASHGNITISSGVTKVTATKGSNAPNSIGAGKDSQAITVNIETGANVIQN